MYKLFIFVDPQSMISEKTGQFHDIYIQDINWFQLVWD